MNDWRLIISGHGDPEHNMAVDEALFAEYERTHRPVLRLYGWRPAGISVGVNQDMDATVYLCRCREAGVPVVRRVTGGNAIYHDDELTYSVVCSTADIGNPRGIKESYRVLCTPIIAMYERLGLRACFSRDDERCALFRRRSVFCFAAWEEYDILVNGSKIGGNAQKRRRDVILQHGSIPLSLDFALIRHLCRDVPEDAESSITSLNSLTGRIWTWEEARDRLIEAFTDNIRNRIEITVV